MAEAAKPTRARVLVTRPAHLQQGVISRLQEAGFEPVSLPLLKIEPIDIESAEAGAIRNSILNLDLYSKVIFISRNAARIGADLIDQYWPQLPIGIDWMAIGQGTADQLAAFGIQASVNPGVDSEALLAAPQLQELTEQRILLIKGSGGRELLQQTLEARGGQVDCIEVYQRRGCSYTETELAERFNESVDAALLTSGEALNSFHQLSLAADMPLVVPSERVALQAAQLGYTEVITATGASDEAMLAAVAQRFS